MAHMGSYSTANVLASAKAVLRDTTATADARLLSDSEITENISKATYRYSHDRPLEKIGALTADGTIYLNLPSDFTDGFSGIVHLESPLDHIPPQWVDSRDYLIVQGTTNSAVQRIRWTRIAPTSGDNLRLYYTTHRTYSATAANTTVLDHDHFAVVDLVVAMCAGDIGNKYARAHEPILGADTSDYGSKSKEWADIADLYLKRYRDGVGVAEGEKPHASNWINWDSQPDPSRDYLFHRKMTR